MFSFVFIGWVLPLLKGLAIGWFLAEFEPLQEGLRLIKNKISDRYWIVMYLKISVSCQKCLSFWSTFIITQNIYSAIVSSLIVVIVDYYKKKD
jgi:hypothetical protein